MSGIWAWACWVIAVNAPIDGRRAHILAVSSQSSHWYDIRQLLIHSLALKYVMEQINAVAQDGDTQNWKPI